MTKKLLLLLIVLTVLAFVACKVETDPKPEPEPTPTAPGEIAYHLSSGNTRSTYTINIDGSANARLPIPTSFPHGHQAWSPDRTTLAVQGYLVDSIYTIKVDGTGLRQLTTIPGVTDTEPAWSPSGQQILFTRFPSTTVNDPEEAELWIMNADGSNQRALGVKGMIAKWSGDGSRIIYTDMVDGNPEIFSCLADGSAEVRLTQSELFEQRPCWSHSGQKIAFSATTGQVGNIAGYEIYVMNADGSNVRQVTRTTAPAMASLPVWRPGR
jgi:Tol biopolymer transport system component